MRYRANANFSGHRAGVVYDIDPEDYREAIAAGWLSEWPEDEGNDVWPDDPRVEDG